MATKFRLTVCAAGGLEWRRPQLHTKLAIFSPPSLFLLTPGAEEQIYEMHTRQPFHMAGVDSYIFVFVLWDWERLDCTAGKYAPVFAINTYLGESVESEFLLCM